MEQLLEAAVLGQRLVRVALGEVRPDERSMGALPQRLALHRGEARLDRLAEAICLHEPVAESLERVDPELPEPLALDRDPVVVPVREQVLREEEAVRARALLLGRVEQAPRLGGRRVDVDGDVSASCSRSPSASMKRWRRFRRQSAERRLPFARSSGESSQSEPATNGRNSERPCRARNTSTRLPFSGSGIDSPPTVRSNEPSSVSRGAWSL